ncbi:tRNA-guanine transglycosylase [Legionella quinlivanii]|uniref:tRNA-guanine transglycosylase n=1 Tax=Legionella quinlivanii TaxID=45073 RepID=UPI002244AA73|nr:tRNA-guanine transglycosylase [Legionella quinlivanii]MCW8451395.1 queuine tRNA-ribosyltransferase family protein [Legionella quinlivanii]
MSGQFIPVVTTSAGNCLSMSNWKSAGVGQLSFYLDELLMKPGLAFFEDNNLDLRSYCGWFGDWVLNLGSLRILNTHCQIRSRYDGQLISIELPELAALILKLNPDFLVLPIAAGSLEILWRDLPANIKLISNSDANPVFGICSYSPGECFKTFYSLVQDSQQPLYLMGSFNWQQFQQLAGLPLHIVESDQPAADALSGKVYAGMEVLNLQDEIWRMDHQPIDKHCGCSACQQGLTRAYFHHLLQHTPLLCQRFLIQHNIHYCLHHLP